MTYAQMLDSIIAKSELSLRSIAKRCAELDLQITPSYISQLKNGKLPPPTAEVSMVLAKACNSKDESKLIFQGYLEKAPDVIKEYMLASSELNKIMIETLYKQQRDEGMAESAIQYLKEMDILSTLELSSKYIKDGKVDFNPELAKELTLASGGMTHQDDKGIITMFLGDTAMQPTVPVHSFIYIMPTKTELLKSRDIILFNIYGKKQPLLRRLYLERERILLIPDDRSSEIFILQSLDEIEYIGKLVSYRIDC
ncbi:MAG: hypothetical protein IJU59_00135 [Firmicutes bacterium]|nr:hypothetical protein [Bacillota bacterium]